MSLRRMAGFSPANSWIQAAKTDALELGSPKCNQQPPVLANNSIFQKLCKEKVGCAIDRGVVVTSGYRIQ